MGALEALTGLVRKGGDLSPYLPLGLTGRAEFLAAPQSRADLERVMAAAKADGISLRVLGSGHHVIVAREEVPGLVLVLAAEAFTKVEVRGEWIVAGAGAPLSAVIEVSARAGLSGLEHLVGEPGTVAGALRLRVPEGEDALIDHVQRIRAVSASGRSEELDAAMLRQGNNSHDPFLGAVIVEVEFQLDVQDQESIDQRLKRCWIERRIKEPLRNNTVGPVFRGADVTDLLRKSDVARRGEGCAEVCDRNPNYIVVRSPANAGEIIGLIEAMRLRVRERFHVDVERQINIW
jgi:UDP-N-acetylmuramate dehydrogenase